MSEDFLTTCISLPTILSYLMYDDLARCMQINNNIYGCINRNWKKMNMKKIALDINAHVDSQTTDKDESEIAKNRSFELNELAAILNALQENYTARDRTVIPYFRNGTYQPIFADIAMALGTRKFEIQIYKENDNFEEIPQRFTFVDLNTRDFAANLMHYNWQLDEIVQLLEDWKSGNRSILDLKVRGRDSNASRPYDWDLLCTTIGVLGVSGNGYRKLCTSRFELRRDIDNKRLDVTYYKFGDNLDIEELL